MARVRPGVDDTLAALSPTRAFNRLDLPTFERPRKAISGTDGAGNCAADKADSRNWVVWRIWVGRARLTAAPPVRRSRPLVGQPQERLSPKGQASAMGLPGPAPAPHPSNRRSAVSPSS